MKVLIAYVLILTAALMAPVQKEDVGKLRPIEVIYIGKDADAVVLKTDTNDVGIGEDVAAALEDMKRTSPAIIYLDTAQYLLIGPGAQGNAMDMQNILKGDVQLCLAEQQPDLELAADYLPSHGKMPRFSDWIKGEDLPILSTENDRIKISKKDEKSA
jgi:hypothetical protein